MMNLMHWRLLVAVADSKNVSRAAERYGITQSGASQALTQMEASLGVKVFVRDRRETTVTAIGEQIIERARRMLSEFESIQNLVDISRGCHLGRIKLASFPSVFASFLPDLLQTFSRMHPSVEIVSLEGTDEEVEQWLASDSIDLGVVMNPDEKRQALSLGRDTWVAVVPVTHKLARRSSLSTVSLRELVEEPFILATGGCYLNGQSLVEREGLALKDIKITVRDWTTAFALIGEGMGISIVPASTLPLDRRGMRVFELSKPIYREFGLVCSQTGQNSPSAQTLLNEIRKSTLGLNIPMTIRGAETKPLVPT
ncbi:LysR family transcriptional regulator [Serratia fonticola]|uniref:LysR family transcriptional regulator n=1 Tax=Serratia fonticola TaxID=47917 RepID=UPI002DBC030F|nr:LysR family transcriptional regulator [Serratia fonticola]MEB7883774.1 LysR family transcriptional regulator [Serratia fonticola]